MTITVTEIADYWVVRRSGEKRTVCITACRSRAIDFAAALAKRTGAQLVVEHRRVGARSVAP